MLAPSRLGTPHAPVPIRLARPAQRPPAPHPAPTTRTTRIGSWHSPGESRSDTTVQDVRASCFAAISAQSVFNCLFMLWASTSSVSLTPQHGVNFGRRLGLYRPAPPHTHSMYGANSVPQSVQ